MLKRIIIHRGVGNLCWVAGGIVSWLVCTLTSYYLWPSAARMTPTEETSELAAGARVVPFDCRSKEFLPPFILSVT